MRNINMEAFFNGNISKIIYIYIYYDDEIVQMWGFNPIMLEISWGFSMNIMGI